MMLPRGEFDRICKGARVLTAEERKAREAESKRQKETMMVSVKLKYILLFNVFLILVTQNEFYW